MYFEIVNMLKDVHSLSDNQIVIDSINDGRESNQGSYVCYIYLRISLNLKLFSLL